MSATFQSSRSATPPARAFFISRSGVLSSTPGVPGVDVHRGHAHVRTVLRMPIAVGGPTRRRYRARARCRPPESSRPAASPGSQHVQETEADERPARDQAGDGGPPPWPLPPDRDRQERAEDRQRDEVTVDEPPRIAEVVGEHARHDTASPLNIPLTCRSAAVQAPMGYKNPVPSQPCDSRRRRRTGLVHAAGVCALSARAMPWTRPATAARADFLRGPRPTTPSSSIWSYLRVDGLTVLRGWRASGLPYRAVLTARERLAREDERHR